MMETVSVLALLAILACGDSAEEPAPSPTARSVLFATPPAATSTGAGDESGSDITVEQNQTATPYPTATTYPTATPYPVAVREAETTSVTVPATPVPQTSVPSADPTSVPSVGPTIRIAIPKKSEVEHLKADSAINSLVERV